MKKPPKVSHRNCAWCSVDGICVPAALHQSFEKQLGPKLVEFDLTRWYETRTAERKAEMTVVGDVWTTWREEFLAEMRFRGWVKPKWEPKPAQEPIQAARLQRLGHTMGRTREETEKHFEQYRAYKNTHHNSE